MQSWRNPRRAVDYSGLTWLYAGGLVLFGFVYLIVIHHSPPDFPRGGADLAQRELERQNYQVYFQAVRVARSLRPDPPGIRWSHIGLSRESVLAVLKPGLWYAQGFADVPAAPGTVMREKWQLVFAPATGEPVYFRMGNLERGDARAAPQAVIVP